MDKNFGQRTIFHVDMDAFFASIEIVQNPSLRGLPVIIGGLPEQRGVVSTCSYEARKFGVHSAMSLFEAKKRCPHAIFLEGNYHLYKKYSEYIMQIFCACTPFVEAVSIDEAYLDVTLAAKQYGGAQKLAKLLRSIVLRKTALTCSVGIASNKLLAKIASSACKPNGILVVFSGDEASFLAPLPIGAIPGIGKKTEAVMNSDGFKIVKDLQDAGMDALIRLYGNWGYSYYLKAFGCDNRPVEWEEVAPKSIGAESTFEKDQTDSAILMDTVKEMCEKAWHRLKKHKMRCRGLSLKLRYSNFYTITRSHTFSVHLNDLEKICSAALQLFHMHYGGALPLRLVGISLEKLNAGYWQPTFWD